MEEYQTPFLRREVGFFVLKKIVERGKNGMITRSVRARIGLILLFLFIFYSELSYATDNRWRYFATNGLGAMLYYDIDSVTVYDNKIVKVWYKIIPNKASESPVREAKFLDEFNCDKRESRSLKNHFYYKDGNVKSDLEKTKWGDIEPETWEESLFNIVCKKK
jgi:hypothetical protein